MANKDIYSEEYLNHSRLSERRKFGIADVSGKGAEVSVEVNWNSIAKRKGYVKISINGEDCVVSREHLYSILFMLGSAEEQEKMAAPFMKQTSVLKFFKMIGVTTVKDLKKGEMVNVPLEFTFNPIDKTMVVGKGSMGALKKMALS